QRRWQERAAEEAHRAAGLEAQLHALVGQPPRGGAELHLSAAPFINWQSAAQVLGVLQSRGHALEDTDSATLTPLAAADPLIPLLLDYREACKRAGSYGAAWLKKHLHPVTSRLHADYLQCGGAAGRMSCVKPNLQSLPRSGSYRSAVR